MCRYGGGLKTDRFLFCTLFRENQTKSRRTIDQFTAEIGSFGIRTITPLQSELLCVLMQIHVAVDMKSIHVSPKCKIIKSAMKRLPGGGKSVI